MSFFKEEKESLKNKNDTEKIEDNRLIEEVEIVNEDTMETSENSVDTTLKDKVSNNLVPLEDNQLKIDTFYKIKEIDKLYKQGIIEYTESIHRYNIEIEKLKNEISLESSKNLKEERALLILEGILEHECKLFETMQHKFSQKLESLVELRDEYKESLEESIYKEKLSRKERELFSFIDEIEEKELGILNQELEKVNLSNTLAKKLKRAEELTFSLKELELEKGYFESTGLNQVSGFKLEHKPVEVIAETVVDTVVMDEEK